MERIMEIRLTGVNELGDVDEKSLVIEIMGRHSNIILINSEGIIVDAVKHVSKNISRVREVLPGRKYVYPPSQDKTNPLNVEAEHVEQVLQYSDDKKSPVELLVKSYIGISTVTAKEICYRGNNNIREIPLAFHNFFLKIKDHALQPAILLDEKDNPVDILPASYKLFPLFLKLLMNSI
jgi:predicted ribosome quality control (RQC) complex YloA/Tae2 family protein